MDEIFGKINSEINIKRYKQEYMSHFEVLRDTIFTALKKNQTFAALYNGNYLRGKYYVLRAMYIDLLSNMYVCF